MKLNNVEVPFTIPQNSKAEKFVNYILSIGGNPEVKFNVEMKEVIVEVNSTVSFLPGGVVAQFFFRSKGSLGHRRASETVHAFCINVDGTITKNLDRFSRSFHASQIVQANKRHAN